MMDWHTFYQRYKENDNEWWRLDAGDMQNMFEDAAEAAIGFEKTATEQIARVEATEAELARMTDLAAMWRAQAESNKDGWQRRGGTAA